MNKTNAILKALAVAGLLVFSQVSWSQNQQPQQGNGNQANHEQKKEERFNELTQKLNLTTDQQTKVREIMKANRAEAQSIRQNNPAKEDRKPKMIALMQKTDEQINGILDAKQQELYKQYKAEKKEKMKEHKQQQKGKSQNDHDDDGSM